jgi:hypothetical protein
MRRRLACVVVATLAPGDARGAIRWFQSAEYKAHYGLLALG